MTDDDAMPELSTSQDGAQPPIASLDAITVLVHSFGTMIASMERRITERITENATASRERWMRWERDFEKYRDATDRRLELLEGRIETVVERARREELVWDARLGPVRNGGMWLARHWRDLALFILGLLAILGFSSEAIREVLGG